MSWPDLANRVAVVTGAAMGMGRTISLRLRREGCHLALCDVDMTALEAVKAECLAIGSAGEEAPRVSIHMVDVADRARVKSFAQEVAEQHGGKVHLLFNNAGIVQPVAFDRMSIELWDKVMAVNLDGVVSCTREFWPQLMAAEQATIANTSSVAGFIPPAAALCTPYATSKYAVRGFSEHLMYVSRVIAPHITVTVTRVTGRGSVGLCATASGVPFDTIAFH